MTEIQVTLIFCVIDDFCKIFLPEYRKTLIANNKSIRIRTDCISESEIATILIWFNFSGHKCFKHFYNNYNHRIKLFFPKIPSYERFINSQSKAFVILNVFLRIFIKNNSQKTAVYYIDSTPMEVCKNQRIYHHKTFKHMAARGVSSCGWFYGFKLHLIANHVGELVSFAITKGNISDGNMTKILAENLEGFLFGDKGYLSNKTASDLLKQGLQLITKVRANMKSKPITKTTKFLLYKRGIIETIIGQLKDFRHLVHTKYRSVTGYFVNVLSSLVAYSLSPVKPRVALNRLGVA